VVIPPEIVAFVGDLVRRVDLLVAFTDVDGKKQAMATLEQKISEAKFWNNPDKAREIMQQLSVLRGAIEVVITLRNRILDLDSSMVLLREEDDESLLADFKEDVNRLSRELDNREIASFLSGKHDRCNAILTIHTGAGGTESCDWADMLLRMYLRWTERRGFCVEIQDIQPGEEAGIGRATIRITGQNAYGYVKSERGVHRLVRISPFDANKRRHTSFCAVDVIAEIEDDHEIEIHEDEFPSRCILCDAFL
jgi:peptide chain release factor 2